MPMQQQQKPTMFEEAQLHSLVAVRPELRILRRVQVQQRAAFRWHFALEGAAVNGRDASLGASRSAVRVNFYRGHMGACTSCNCQERAAVAGAWINGLVRTARNE